MVPANDFRTFHPSYKSNPSIDKLPWSVGSKAKPRVLSKHSCFGPQTRLLAACNFSKVNDLFPHESRIE